MIVGDNTIQAKSLGDFFKSHGKKHLIKYEKNGKTFSKNFHQRWILQQT